jgi:hypothetical protein
MGYVWMRSMKAGDLIHRKSVFLRWAWSDALSRVAFEGGELIK